MTILLRRIPSNLIKISLAILSVSLVAFISPLRPEPLSARETTNKSSPSGQVLQATTSSDLKYFGVYQAQTGEYQYLADLGMNTLEVTFGNSEADWNSKKQAADAAGIKLIARNAGGDFVTFGSTSQTECVNPNLTQTAYDFANWLEAPTTVGNPGYNYETVIGMHVMHEVFPRNCTLAQSNEIYRSIKGCSDSTCSSMSRPHVQVAGKVWSDVSKKDPNNAGRVCEMMETSYQLNNQVVDIGYVLYHSFAYPGCQSNWQDVLRYDLAQDVQLIRDQGGAEFMAQIISIDGVGFEMPDVDKLSQVAQIVNEFSAEGLQFWDYSDTRFNLTLDDCMPAGGSQSTACPSTKAEYESLVRQIAQGAMPQSPTTGCTPGDSDDSGMVDLNDLKFILSHYHGSGADICADQNGDNLINGFDFSEVAAMLYTPPPPQIHKECQDNQCVDVSGEGIDKCASNADCIAPPPASGEKGLIGILAVPQSGFYGAKSLGASSVSLSGYLAALDLQSSLTAAKSEGLGIIGRAQSRSAFTNGMKLDFAKLESIISAAFSANDIASDPDFLGYYIIDEPCHPSFYDISPSEMNQFYQTVKGVDPNIEVLVNFSELGCAQQLITAGPVADIATFTITSKASKSGASYIGSQASVARSLKQTYPDLRVVPWIAVYEYPDMGIPFPSADFVREQGMETLNHEGFDGVMYYSWIASSYMGETIQDVVDDPAYISAFNDVFDAARAKWER